MDNTPVITDYTAVAEYLKKFNVDFQVTSIKEEENPANDLISFKYTVTFETHKNCGKKMRVSLYSTHDQWIRHASKSCWEMVNSIFHHARLAFIDCYKDFCLYANLEQNEDSKKFYAKCKRQRKRLVDIGLTRIDIAEIVNHSYNAQLKG